MVLTGLQAKPELNGCVGMVMGGVAAESGRVPLRLIAPKEHAGRSMMVKPANLKLLAQRPA